MRFVCEKCRTKYSIADEKVKGKVLKIRCKKCNNVIVVKGPKKTADGKDRAVKDRDKASAEGKKDKLDEEFEKAFDRLTMDKRSAARETGGKVRSAPDLDREFSAAEGEEWFAIIRGRQLGPMSFDELARAVKEELVTHGTYVWRDGMADWVRAARCAEIRPLLPDRRKPKPKPAEKSGATFGEDEKTKMVSQEQARILAEQLEAEKKEEEREAAGESPELRAADEAGTAPAVAEEEREILEDRRAQDLAGMPPPMPEEDEEIVIAPAVTGRLVTLKAAVAMSIASSVVSIVATALIIELTKPPPQVKVVQESNRNVNAGKKKRKKIVLTPELLALKSKLFGENTDRRPGRTGRSRQIRKKGSGTRPLAKVDVDGLGPKGQVDLASTFKNTGLDLDERRGSRGVDSAGGEVALGGAGGVASADSLSGLSRRNTSGAGGDAMDFGERKVGASLDAMNGAGLPEGLPPEVVAARFQGMWIETCYNRALKRDPSMKGKMIVTFEIRNNGRVYSVKVSPPKFQGTFLAQCFMREIKKIRFPRFRGDPIPIEYPFLLSAR